MTQLQAVQIAQRFRKLSLGQVFFAFNVMLSFSIISVFIGDPYKWCGYIGV